MAKTVKDVLNDAPPNALPDMLRALRFGDLVRSLPTYLRHKDPAADTSQLATLESFGVALKAPAATILRAYARAGTATALELAIQAANTTPATGQIAVSPNGDIVVLAADAWTDVDVEYQPTRGEYLTLSLPVASNALAIPAAVTARGVVHLVAATATAGTSAGVKIVLAASASAAAAGQARLDLAKANVKFNATDAITAGTVVLFIAHSTDVDATLESTSTAFI